MNLEILKAMCEGWGEAGASLGGTRNESILPNRLLKKASGEAAGSENPEAY